MQTEHREKFFWAPASQALDNLVQPVLQYLDLELACAELEVDKFRDEDLGAGFKDLDNTCGARSDTIIQH
jgi:hypothetical protein